MTVSFKELNIFCWSILYISFYFISASKGHWKTAYHSVLLITFCCIESLKVDYLKPLSFSMENTKCINFTVIKKLSRKLEILTYFHLSVSQGRQISAILPWPNLGECVFMEKYLKSQQTF
jgi:hypothetical protein